MGKVHSRHSFLLPALAEGVLVVKQAKFLNDVVHDQVGVDEGLACNHLFVGFAEVAYLGDVKTLFRIKLNHSHDHLPQLSTILLGYR